MKEIIIAPEKRALYFGCLGGLGHFLHDIRGRHVFEYRDSGEVVYRSTDRATIVETLPWNIGHMDGGLLKNGKRRDVEDGKVFWTCGGARSFWYAFYWWDNSVDHRGASNSGIYVEGFGWPAPVEAFEYGCAQYPEVIARQRFPLVLQEPMKGNQ